MTRAATDQHKAGTNGKATAWPTLQAEAVADWLGTWLVHRWDVYGAYTPDGGQYTAHEALTRELLVLHARGEITIGFHSISIDGLCKTAALDIDAHSEGDDPRANWRCAHRAVELFADLGLEALIFDSNSVGGYHVRVFFKRPVPSAVAYWLCRRVVAMLEAEEFKAPETFPKQPERTLTAPYGNWLRGPGKHHKRGVWTRVWCPKRRAWLEGEAAVRRLIAVKGDDTAKLLEAYSVERKAREEAEGPKATKAERERSQRQQKRKDRPCADEVRSALAALPAAMADPYGGTRADCGWLGVGMCVHNYDNGPTGLGLWKEWSRGSDSYEEGVCEAKWGTFTQNGGFGIETVFFHAYQNGWQGWAPPKGEKSSGTKGQTAEPAGDDEGVSSGFILGAKDIPLSCATNTAAWINAHKPAGWVRYDRFRRMILLGGEPLSDQHVIELAMKIERSLQAPWAKTHVEDAIVYLAHKNEFSSLTEYLEGVRWDGVERIDRFLADHYGVDQTPYHAEVSRILFLSAAARAYEPGCKVDTVPILIGLQGTGKSEGTAALCPVPEWFTDDIGNDLFAGKAGEGLQGKWFVELAELARVSRSTIEVVKSFISRRVDRYRPPYGRIAQDFPRTCVFVGTTNDDQPLQDTENRRYLPVRVKQADPAAIAAVRDQLWGEAVSRYKGGEKWWTTSDNLVAEARKQGRAASATDAWTDALRPFLDDRDQTTVTEAARLLNIPVDRLDRSAQTRIGLALRKLGFRVERETTGDRERFYKRETDNV